MKLSLERVFNESLPAIYHCDTDNLRKTTRNFLRQVDILGRENSNGLTRLEIEDFNELVNNPHDNERFAEAIPKVLASEFRDSRGNQFRIFKPGYSAVMLGDIGELRGVAHSPNPEPKLAAYGHGLKFALKKAGIAFAVGKHRNACPLIEEGYKEVINITKSRKSDIITKLSDKPHLGFAGIEVPAYGSYDTSIYGMRAFESYRRYIGVSGVLTTGRYLQELRQDPNLDEIAKLAIDQKLLNDNDGERWDGNLFAGSIDSAVGQLVIGHTYDYTALKALIPEVQIPERILAHAALGLNIH